MVEIATFLLSKIVAVKVSGKQTVGRLKSLHGLCASSVYPLKNRTSFSCPLANEESVRVESKTKNNLFVITQDWEKTSCNLKFQPIVGARRKKNLRAI
jgi:hypothetical protein